MKKIKGYMIVKSIAYIYTFYILITLVLNYLYIGSKDGFDIANNTFFNWDQNTFNLIIFVIVLLPGLFLNLWSDKLKEKYLTKKEIEKNEKDIN